MIINYKELKDYNADQLLNLLNKLLEEAESIQPNSIEIFSNRIITKEMFHNSYDVDEEELLGIDIFYENEKVSQTANIIKQIFYFYFEDWWYKNYTGEYRDIEELWTRCIIYVLNASDKKDQHEFYPDRKPIYKGGRWLCPIK